MYQKQLPSEHTDDNAKLEVGLFKYLYDKKLITQEDFKKACGNSLRGIKFPTEFNYKIKRAYIRCLHSFLAEKKDVGFLDDLQKEHPESYPQIQHYLKHFYYKVILQMIKNHHTMQMKFKYAMLCASLRGMRGEISTIQTNKEPQYDK
jgi:hypothetical protein